jgi:hypothetical protein
LNGHGSNGIHVILILDHLGSIVPLDCLYLLQTTGQEYDQQEPYPTLTKLRVLQSRWPCVSWLLPSLLVIKKSPGDYSYW